MPIEGTAASYTFYPGDTVTSYTFKFQDGAGNTGSITADLKDLPLTVKSTEPVREDVDPEYGLYVYGKIGGVYVPTGYYSSLSPVSALYKAVDDTGFVQDYYFDIDVIEDSSYKIILLSGKDADISSVTYSGSTSDVIDGVTLSGRTVKVTKESAFTAVIVDKWDNKKAFSLEIGEYLDNTPPTIDVNKEYKTLYKIYQYIKLSDTSNKGYDTGSVELLVPAYLPTEKDINSKYFGQYYYEFTENKEVTITYRDRAGNTNSTAIKVDNLDMSAPVATVTWSPCYYYIDSEGNLISISSMPPDKPTNSNVTATVSYDKSIAGVSAEISYTGGEIWTPVTDNTFDSVFELKTSSNSATVVFKESGAFVKLIATGLNGKTAETILEMDDIIDKAAPHITSDVTYEYKKGYELGTPYAAKITLTPDEDVYCLESVTPDKLITNGNPIEFTVFSKGTYTYHFTDIAGNVSVKTVKVDGDIDRIPPEIKVEKDDGTLTSGNVTVIVSINENGTLVVTGNGNTVKYEVGKDETKSLNISNNGSYKVTAWDEAGNEASTVFMVGNIDRSAPSVTLSPSTVSIREGGTAEDLKALLDQGFIVTDNISKNEAIDKSYDKSQVDLNKPGVYTVTYTAEDEAGNRTTATRYVRVYSKLELEVLLNGKKTYENETLALSSQNITITVNNPLKGKEPYTIYLGRGILTEGQIKRNSSVVKPDGAGRFTVPSKGFYTLYIVTQSRQSYLTIIYVEGEQK